MNAIQYNLALQHHVNPCFLEYVGIWDETATVGKVMYLFNVMDPMHAKYRSTVVWMESR